MSYIKIQHGKQELEITYSTQPAEPELGIQGPYIEEMSEILWNNIDVVDLLEPHFDEIEKEIWEKLKACGE